MSDEKQTKFDLSDKKAVEQPFKADGEPGQPMADLLIEKGLKKGGDIIFSPGPGYENAPGGSFIFKDASGAERMRLDPDGRSFVRGNLVSSDPEVWIAFREWVMRCIRGAD